MWVVDDSRTNWAWVGSVVELVTGVSRSSGAGREMRKKRGRAEGEGLNKDGWMRDREKEDE